MPGYIYAYNNHSAGARALSQATGARLIRHNHSRYRPRWGHVVVNWGANETPNLDPALVINPTANVRLATDKWAALAAMSNVVPVPEFTANIEQAMEWFEEADGTKPVVVCRTLLRAHSGRGIVLANTPDQLVNAPLYVRYIPKRDEYRVHMVRDLDRAGDVDGPPAALVTKKARKLDVPNDQVNWQIRNHDNGFIYALADEQDNQRLLTMAHNALRELGLTFGAVDIIYNAARDRYYVLEVNTAPGLEGRTIIFYAEEFLQWDNFR